MRKLLYTFIQTGLFAVISCVGLSLQAQDTLFIQSVSADQIPDSPEMGAYRERLRKNPNITGYHFIRLNAKECIRLNLAVNTSQMAHTSFA